MYSLVHPQYALPVHGEYRHLRANAQVAVQLGIPRDHIMILHSGDVLEIDRDGAEVVDQVQARPVLVDGTRIGDVSKDVMRDRKQLAQDGVVVAVIPLDMKERRMTAAPKINSRGFVFLTGDDTLIEEACETLKKTVERKLSDDKVGKSKLKESVRSTLINFMLQETGRKPLVMPILLDAADE